MYGYGVGEVYVVYAFLALRLLLNTGPPAYSDSAGTAKSVTVSSA